MIYYYKDKPYEIFEHSKRKENDKWIDIIIYKTLYHNPDGKYWVRDKKDFFELFKPKT